MSYFWASILVLEAGLVVWAIWPPSYVGSRKNLNHRATAVSSASNGHPAGEGVKA